tara:strand:- start:321 stop:593 length:273 start_codon:yes stop_codon:yes gene_type:complete
MANQPTIGVTITASEARSILQGHMLDLGRRTEAYGDRDTFAFMIDISLKSVRHWKHIVEQFEAIEKIDRAPGRNKIAAKFSDKELRKLIA